MMKVNQIRADVIPYNFQIWLLTCLLKLNDFEDAELIIGSIWGDEKLDLRIHKDLLQTLFETIEIMIGQLFEKMPQNQNAWSRRVMKDRVNKKLIDGDTKGVQICQSAQDLALNLPKVIRIIGIHLGLNSVVFLRLMKVVNHYMIDTCNDESIRTQAFKLAGEYFLPGLCVLDSHYPQLDQELWNSLKHIDFKTRFIFYQDLLSRNYLTNFCLLEKLIHIQPKVVKWSKSLSDEKE